MQEYRVGTLYNKNRKQWPQAIEYNYRGVAARNAGAHELRMFLGQLKKSEVEQIRSGSCRFSLVVEGDIIFLCSDFGTPSPWSDSPYTIHMVSEHERVIPPELAPGEMALLTIILVHAETGIIAALRQISLGHDFSVTLHNAIRGQAERPFNQARYDRQLAEVYRKYPTTQALLLRAQATCIIEESSQQN